MVSETYAVRPNKDETIRELHQKYNPVDLVQIAETWIFAPQMEWGTMAQKWERWQKSIKKKTGFWGHLATPPIPPEGRKSIFRSLFLTEVGLCQAGQRDQNTRAQPPWRPSSLHVCGSSIVP